MRLYVISGSLRAASVHSALLRAFRENAPNDIEIELCDLVAELPIFNPDREGDLTPPSVLAFAKKVEDADGLVIASPEYAHGIPGGLKNAFDWLVSRAELVGKPAMLVHAYAFGRGAYGLSALEEVLRTASLQIMPGETFSVSLVGRTINEAEAVLKRAETAKSISDALSEFRDWVSNLS